MSCNFFLNYVCWVPGLLNNIYRLLMMKKMSWCSSLVVSLSMGRAIYWHARAWKGLVNEQYILCWSLCVTVCRNIRSCGLQHWRFTKPRLPCCTPNWFPEPRAASSVCTYRPLYLVAATATAVCGQLFCSKPRVVALFQVLITWCDFGTDWCRTFARLAHFARGNYLQLIKKAKQSISIDICAISKDPGLSTSKYRAE